MDFRLSCHITTEVASAPWAGWLGWELEEVTCAQVRFLSRHKSFFLSEEMELMQVWWFFVLSLEGSSALSPLSPSPPTQPSLSEKTKQLCMPACTPAPCLSEPLYIRGQE